MTPLGLVVLGCLVAVLDLRLQDLDLLLDPVGWLVVLRGVRRLGLPAPGVAAVVAGVLSLTEVVLTDDPLVGWLHTGYGIAQTVFFVLLCLALRERAHADRFSAFALGFVVLGTVGVLLGLLLQGADDAGDVLGPGVVLLAVGLSELALAVWLLVVLYRARREPWAQDEPVRAAPPGAAAPSGG